VHYSDDKLLQTRIFSYQDTQRHRLGGNYLLLPVNAPKCAHHNNHHDGFMNVMQRTEEVGGWVGGACWVRVGGWGLLGARGWVGRAGLAGWVGGLGGRVARWVGCCCAVRRVFAA
jgi:hypothetical protein